MSAGRSAATGSEADAQGARREVRLTLVGMVLAVGLLAIAVAAVVVLLQQEPRRAGTNLTADRGYVLALPPGQQLCEPGELLPGDTGALRLDASAGGLPGPRLSATLSAPGGLVSTGQIAGGWHAGTIVIPVRRVAQTRSAATVCLRNLGLHQVLLGGSVPDSGFFISIAGRPMSGRLRIEYLRPGRESWLALVPTLAHRFSLAKSDLVRHWAAAAALLLMLLAVGLATRAMFNEERSP